MTEGKCTDNRALLIVYDITFGMTIHCGGLKVRDPIDQHAMSYEGGMIALTSRLRRQPVQRVVALAHSPNLSAESERGGGGKRPAVGVDVGDGNLDGSVVLRGDKAV